MGQVTIDDIRNFLLYLVAFGTATATIVKAVKSAIEKGFKPINDKIDKVDKNATMNYIVSQMHEIENGTKLDGVSKMRFYEQYEHYTKDLNGNTYIHDEFERMKKEGKI